MMTSRGVVMTSRGVISKLEFEADIKGYYSLNSLAMLTAMSLKANELPEMKYNIRNSKKSTIMNV